MTRMIGYKTILLYIILPIYIDGNMVYRHNHI
jgi:hypothetical protein